MVGVVVHGLLYLLAIGIVLLIGDVVFLASGRRGPHARADVLGNQPCELAPRREARLA